MASQRILEIEGLCSWYGSSQILRNVTLCVNKSEVVCVAGRNGSGRTTLMKAILRMVPRQIGSVTFLGSSLATKTTPSVARMGIGYCPEGREVFTSLSCEENLTLIRPRNDGAPGMSMEEIYAVFPNLYERRKSKGGALSGGEQQMLALARIMRVGAHLYMLDEISEGLAPIIVEKLYDILCILKQKGATMLIAEQNFGFASAIADRIAFMEHGEIAEEVDASIVSNRQDLVDRFLTI